MSVWKTRQQRPAIATVTMKNWSASMACAEVHIACKMLNADEGKACAKLKDV